MFPFDDLTLMSNAVSGHKHKFIGTNLTQMNSAVLGFLELRLNAFQSPGLTQKNTVNSSGNEFCLLRI